MTDFSQRRVMMVDTQIRPSDVTKFPIIEAMLAIPREAYVPQALVEAAYVGGNLDVAEGRTLLEARSFSKLLDALDVQPSDVILDLGCGLGYSAAVLARIGKAVIAVETEALAAQAQSRLSAQGVDNVAVLAGALTEGAAKQAPYDVIVIEGAVETVPQALLDQLAEGGRIGAIFMDGTLGVARVGHKGVHGVTWRDVFNASAPVIAGFQKAREFSL